MRKKILWMGFALVLASSLQVYAQNTKKENTFKKWFVGSSLFMLGNFDKTNNPE